MPICVFQTSGDSTPFRANPNIAAEKAILPVGSRAARCFDDAPSPDAAAHANVIIMHRSRRGDRGEVTLKPPAHPLETAPDIPKESIATANASARKQPERCIYPAFCGPLAAIVGVLCRHRLGAGQHEWNLPRSVHNIAEQILVLVWGARQYCGGASTVPPSWAAACQPHRGS
jgi:hypothetical protein